MHASGSSTCAGEHSDSRGHSYPNIHVLADRITCKSSQLRTTMEQATRAAQTQVLGPELDDRELGEACAAPAAVKLKVR